MDSNLECLTIQNISKLDINQDFAQKYLEYLMTLIHKPVDFIQAAVVMQALSSVFAKKVDNLQEQVLQFHIIFRKLELGRLNEVGAPNEEEEGDDPENRDRAKSQKKKNDKEALLNRFEDICSDVSLIRKSCIKKFTYEEVKKADSFLVRNKISECPRVKTKDDFSCYIYDSKEEVLGRKEEFSINGILCNGVIPKEDFCLSCDHGENGAAIDDSVFNVPAESHQMDIDTNPPSVINPMEIDHEPLDVPPSPGDPGSQSYQNVVEEFLNNSNLDESDTSGFAYFEKMNKVGEAVVNVDQMIEAVWNPICDNNKAIERQLKTRSVVKLPECLRKEENISKCESYPNNYVLADLLLGMFKYKSGLPFSSCIANGLQKEEEYRRKMLMRENKRRRKKRNNPTVETETEFRGFNAFGDDDDRDHGIFENENDIAPFEDVMPSNDSDTPLSPNHPPAGHQDYLENAIKNIEEYQKGLQPHPDDTINEIASKVSSWHDSIRPILEREEERTCFDIHEYGSQILQKFPQNSGKNTLTFASVVENQPREEIPRFFLSSLLLANSYNVAISRDDQNELGVNDMNLTVLSRVRQHETLDQDMRKDYS
ncbi:condensin-2 complex subunit H2-like isoform X2 [Planococcus citri]|uniref:condensin-2 complex subunit H2-like isoform X2 n=1 Tax=Planococcus citri TaxID=170843 RepID=UPI0031F8E84D